MEDLHGSGIKKATIISNSLHYPQIFEALDKINPKVKINLIKNGITKPEKALGDLGDLLFAYQKIKPAKNTNFLVLPCDTTYWNQFSIKDFLQFAKSNGL